MSTDTTPAATAAAPLQTPTSTAATSSVIEASTAAPSSIVEAATTQISTPDSGDIEIKLPENFTVEPDTLAGFKSTAKELGLDGPKAQKLFDQYVALEAKRADAASKSFAEQDAKWSAELMADPDVGGQKLAQTKAAVRRAVEHLGGDSVREALTQAGLGNHPALVRGLVKLGRSLGEDTVSGSTPAAGDKGAEVPMKVLMYPTMHAKSKP